MKIDIGCGMRKEEGWFGVDLRKYPGVDAVLNIGTERIPVENDSVDEMKAIHVLEHLRPEELFFFLDSAWELMKPKGFLHVEVPRAMTRAYFINPDHRIQFTQDTFGYFQVPGNPEHKDPHGVMKHFWHIEILEDPNPEAISVNMYPNKEGGKYDYVKVI
jgi:hypothetical protein